MGRRRLILVGICILMLGALYATELDAIVEQAKQNSSTIRLITLSKQNSDIVIAQGEVEETLGLEVSGDLSYVDSTLSTWTQNALSLSPSIVIRMPNDGNTKITVAASSISRPLTAGNLWSADPSVKVSHTFRFGDTGDTLDDLELARQRLEIDQTYQQRLYDFESSIYVKIGEILNHEMTLLNNEKDLLVQRTKIENALKLKTTAVGSTTYRSMELELARLEHAKAATVRKLEMTKAQYQQLTGLNWDGVEAIWDADITFSALTTGDTSVIIAALDLEIAKEQLALTKRASVRTTTGSTVPSLTISGETGLVYNTKATPSLSYDVIGSAVYSTKNYSTGASIDLDISDTGAVSPRVTISGSWRNNQTVVSDELTIQSLENAVTIAGIDYQEARLDYTVKSNQLESDILSHQLEVEQFAQSASLRKQVLAQALDAFEKGLVTKTEVDQARLDVELSSYEEKIYALQALILENRAKALQL